MTTSNRITVQTTVRAPLSTVWSCWTEPADIMQWNSASEDWHTPRATNDLRDGGTFTARMEAKDGSMGFDFGGTYTKVVPQQLIEYTMGDKRTVSVQFESKGEETIVTEHFDPETENSAEMQKAGWQSIMDNFKKYVEAK